MGTERASKTRQRERGQIYCYCSNVLHPLPAWTPGERVCALCVPRPHRVLMNFMDRYGWTAHFVAADCRTPISRHFTLPNVEALRRLAREGHVEDVEGFERGIRTWGRGSQFLRLTEEQYRRLTRFGDSKTNAATHSIPEWPR